MILRVLEADMITIKKKHWFDVSMIHFLQDLFQMTAIALVSVINHCHINRLNLLLDTLYI